MLPLIFLFTAWAALGVICVLGIALIGSSRRERIATAALQGLLADAERRYVQPLNEDHSATVARVAVAYADALIREVEKEGKSTP